MSKRYLRKVRAIVHESEKLRPIFEAQSQSTVAEGMQKLVGIAPAFDLDRYGSGLREQYGNLKLESLDTTGVYYSELKLWRMFVPRNVRECQEFLPQVYEIPKEHGRRLRQSGQLDEAELAEAELEQYRRWDVERALVEDYRLDPKTISTANAIGSIHPLCRPASLPNPKLDGDWLGL